MKLRPLGRFTSNAAVSLSALPYKGVSHDWVRSSSLSDETFDRLSLETRMPNAGPVPLAPTSGKSVGRATPGSRSLRFSGPFGRMPKVKLPAVASEESGVAPIGVWALDDGRSPAVARG